MEKILRISLIGSLMMASFNLPVFAVGSGALQNITAVTTRSMGTGYTFGGVANDASAIYFNPGGLTQVKGAEVILGGTYLTVDSEHTASQTTAAAASGKKDKMPGNIPLIGFLYTSYSGSESPWAFGLGINSPYGLVTEWKDDSFARFYATKSKLLMYNINPTAAYAINDQLSLGVGIDYFNVYDVELNRKIYNGPLAEGSAKLTGDGNAWGYNTGVHYKVNEKHSLGLSYRSQVNVNVEGDLDVNNALVYVGPTSFKTGVSAEFKFPQSVLVGYGFRPNEKWTLSADYNWVDWSAVKETRFNYQTTHIDALQPGNVARNWKSSNNIGAGAEFHANDWLDLRGGLFAYERVVPSSTLEATLPDASRWGITLGSGFKLAATKIDLGYNLIMYNNRSVNNNQEFPGLYSQDGKFKTTAHAFSVSVTHKWGGL